jgi:hypothetical protein
MQRVKQIKQEPLISAAKNISILGFMKQKSSFKEIKIKSEYELKEIIHNGIIHYIPRNK